MLKKNKTAIIVILLILVAISIFNIFSKDPWLIKNSAFLLEVKIPEDYQTVKMGDGLIVDVFLHDFKDRSRKDVLIRGRIIDEKGKEYDIIEKTIAIQTMTSTLMYLHTKEVKETGVYTVDMDILNNENIKIAHASARFRIVESYETYTEKAIIYKVLIIILSMSLSASLFMLFYYKKIYSYLNEEEKVDIEDLEKEV